MLRLIKDRKRREKIAERMDACYTPRTEIPFRGKTKNNKTGAACTGALSRCFVILYAYGYNVSRTTVRTDGSVLGKERAMAEQIVREDVEKLI